jgi:dipeptidyl aminopeptidase/acylaminoacyl peptidase
MQLWLAVGAFDEAKAVSHSLMLLGAAFFNDDNLQDYVSGDFLNRSRMEELLVVSTLDGASEPSLYYHPGRSGKVPLVVGLHTWSHDRFNQVENMLPLCWERGWALLLPEFRGPNLSTNPRARQACGSPYARQDIIEALDMVVNEHSIDAERIFLLGGSGGGHMALLIAGIAPLRWKGVSAWVPITNLATWHGENSDYAPHVAACVGGKPGSDVEVDREYRERSPLFLAKELSSVTLSLHHGRHDPIVHYRQSWELARELEKQGAERFYFETFDGGHEIHYERAFHWFDGLSGNNTKTGEMLTG